MSADNPQDPVSPRLTFDSYVIPDTYGRPLPRPRRDFVQTP